MTDMAVIKAESRDRAGKGAARAVRNAGMVPGVIYGKKQEPVLFQMDPRSLTKLLNRPGFFAHVLKVEVKGETYSVLPKDVQLHPVTDRPLHVDFLRFSDEDKVTLPVRVVFANEAVCPGIKRGGVLNVVRHEIEVTCAPNAIPEKLIIDLAASEIGDSIHISAVALPSGVTPTIVDRDFTVATIIAPSGLKAETGETPEEQDEEA